MASSWILFFNYQDDARFNTHERYSKICFIDSFKVAVHVSGDGFAHLQEHYDCIYSFLEQCTDSVVCCRQVTDWMELSHLSAADSTVGALFQKAVCTVRVLLKIGETVVRNL